MEIAKIKVLTKKPSVRIDVSWFPYRDIVDKTEFDKVCRCIEAYIEKYGINKLKVSYEVIEIDDNDNPEKFVVECKVKTGFLKEIESNYIFRRK